MTDSNRIVFNTIVKYTELVCNIIISIAVLRFVLQALGTEDYGVYMVVAGMVAMLGVLSSSMSSTAMRFMAHTLGKDDLDTSLKAFNTSFAIHLVLGFLLILILEIGGWLMFDYFLNIPTDKIGAAKIVYQMMILNSFITILTVPFDAIINSQENLLFLSTTAILHNLLKLLLAVALLSFEGNRLVMFGICLVIISIGIMFLRIAYCRYHYSESRIALKSNFDKELAKAMFAFTGWELFSSMAEMFSTHLRGLLLNVFFGVRVNAGEGIAKNVNSQANMVSIGITNAITPQMNKSEGAGNRKRLIQLTLVGVKYTSFMFGLVAIPLLLELPFALKVWLKTVPEYAAIFCQLCIILQFISKLTWQISNAIRAVGKIKAYRITGGMLSLISLFIAFIVFNLGGGPLTIFYVQIIFCLISGGVTLWYGKNIVGIMPLRFIRETTIPIVLPLLLSLAFATVIQQYMNEGWMRLIIVSALGMGTFTIMFWIMGVTHNERIKLQSLFEAAISRVSICK